MSVEIIKIPDVGGAVDSVNGQTGAVVLDKTDIGLTNVDNTSDANKPISDATQTALNGKQETLVSATNIKTLNGTTLLGSEDIVVNKTTIGLSNVDNTSDANKPISDATQTALNGKQDKLVSATNIKTVNSTSLLGSGDISISTLRAFYSQSNLTIDGANGDFFIISLDANASFSLSNITTGKIYYFLIKNTSASEITITLPNTADIKSALTFTIPASNNYKEVAMIYDGTNRIWQISEALVWGM